MERNRKIELIQRTLGIRHKLRVHESMKAPDTHEELAKVLLGKWELEDELHAIEEILTEERRENIGQKKTLLLKGIPLTAPQKEAAAPVENLEVSDKVTPQRLRSSERLGKARSAP